VSTEGAHPEAALERIEYRFSWKGKGLASDDGPPEALVNGTQIGTTICKSAAGTWCLIARRHALPGLLAGVDSTAEF
jgi:hypothetical protein